MDEKTLTIQAMADCMDMVRQELIEAGIIDADIAPMFVANAVLHQFHIEQKKAEHWKSNHDDLVKRCALLREREDLPVDRIPAYNELVRLRAENERLIGMVRFANSIIHDDPVLSAKLWKIANEKEGGA